MVNVFVNILENSIKYSMNSPSINIKTYLKNKNIVVSITDKGIGMSKNVKSKILIIFIEKLKVIFIMLRVMD